MYPATISECHQRLALAKAEMDALRAAYTAVDAERLYLINLLKDAQRVNEWLTRRVRSYEDEISAWELRAQTVESRLREIESAARYTDRAFAVTTRSIDALVLGYEMGSVAILKLLPGARAPPHPRLLLEDALRRMPPAPVRSADPESAVEDEDAVSASAAAAGATLPKEGEHQGHEADAHARARYHQGCWAAAAAAIDAGVVHSKT